MKAIIIDDELLPSKLLEEMIKKHCFEITDIEIYNSAFKAIEHLKNAQYDIIFLDIEMPEMNSFDFLERANIAKGTEIIFVTAYSKYAVEAFKQEATHYLLKPIDKRELIIAVRRAVRNKTRKKRGSDFLSKISIYDGEKYQLIAKDNIIRMEAKGSYTIVILDKGKTILTSKRIGYYERQLSSSFFFRCHHSHLVNIDKILSIEKGKSGLLVLINSEVAPISSSRKEELKMMLNL